MLVPSRVFKPRSFAFTLVELLVVLAIIGVLTGLLLPAVQQVRAAAQRIQCANQLKQQSLAMLNYENAHRHFPAGFQVPGGAMWTALILPWIEQDNLFASLDLSGPWNGRAGETQNTIAMATRLTLLNCPASGFDAAEFDALADTDRFPCSYLACASGLNDRESGPKPWCGMDVYLGQAVSDGVFYQNSETRIADIFDGTSHTVFLGEATSDQNVTDLDLNGQVQKVDHWFIGSDEVHAFLQSPVNSGELSECLGSTACRINSLLLDGATINEIELSFGSYHAGGANMAFVDGHIQFVISGIDPIIWSAIGTRDFGEITSGN